MQSLIIGETKNFAIELYSLLKELDPIRWKEEKKQVLKDKISALEIEVNRIYKEFENSAHEFVQKHKNYSSITERLHHLREILAELKDTHTEPKTKKEYLNLLRKKLETNYHELANLLESYSVKIPRLRPTNYARSFFHMLSALVALALIELIPSTSYLVYISLAFFLSAWTMEISRRLSDKAQEKIMKFFMPVAHLHEEQKINSATWYSTALLIISLTHSTMACGIAVIVLGFADPAAAAIGRRYGKIKLTGGRSLEGSLTFVLVGALTTFLLLNTLHPMGTVLNMALISIGAGIFGAIGELFGGILDDNITIPLSTTFGTLFLVNLFLF